MTPLPREVWARVGEVADAVIRTVEARTPSTWHVIFTAYLDGVTDTGGVPRLEEVAAARGSVFVPVRLLIDPGEDARRIVSPERRSRMKSVHPTEPTPLAALGEPYDRGHANTLTIDVTSTPPNETALEILSHAAAPHTDQSPLG